MIIEVDSTTSTTTIPQVAATNRGNFIINVDTCGTRYSRNMQGNPATPDCPVAASRPQDGGAQLTTCVNVNDLIVQQGGERGAAAAGLRAIAVSIINV